MSLSSQEAAIRVIDVNTKYLIAPDFRSTQNSPAAVLFPTGKRLLVDAGCSNRDLLLATSSTPVIVTGCGARDAVNVGCQISSNSPLLTRSR